MEIFLNYFFIFFTASIVENTIFVKASGISTLLFHTKERKSTLPFGICITYFCIMASLISYYVGSFLETVENSYVYAPVIYVFLIGIVYILTLIILYKFFYKFFFIIKKFIHISAFNSAIMLVVYATERTNLSLLECLISALGTGLGFFIAHFVVSISYERLHSEAIPESFRGFPSVILYIGVISMALYALL